MLSPVCRLIDLERVPSENAWNVSDPPTPETETAKSCDGWIATGEPPNVRNCAVLVAMALAA